MVNLKEEYMTRLFVLLFVSIVGLVACAPRESGRKQHIEFERFTVEEGVYKPKPGWTFTRGEKDTIVVAKDNNEPGVIITPCECALEKGGPCLQAHSEDPRTGDIKEVWCVDNDCGFCVGGTAEPNDPSSSVRFNVVCIDGRQASQR